MSRSDHQNGLLTITRRECKSFFETEIIFNSFPNCGRPLSKENMRKQPGFIL